MTRKKQREVYFFVIEPQRNKAAEGERLKKRFNRKLTKKEEVECK